MYLVEILLIISFAIISYLLLYFSVLKKHFNNYKGRVDFKIFGKKLPVSKIIFGFNLLCFLFFAAIFIYLFILSPNVTYVSVVKGGAWHNYNEPFVVVFDRPVNKAALKYSFTKSIKGEWKYEKANRFDLFKRKLVFIPEESLLPSNKMIFTATYKPALGFKTGILRQDFATGGEKPELKFTNNVDDNQNVDPEAEVHIKIDKGDPYAYDFAFEAEPPINLSVSKDSSDPSSFKVIHSEPFKNGQQYHIKIFSIPVSYNLKTKEIINSGDKVEAGQIKFQAAPTPVIKEVLPKGDSVLANEQISITFDHEMDRESVLKGIKLSPDMQLSPEWNEEGNRLVLKPAKNFEKETDYKLLISKNIKSKYGARLVQDFDTNKAEAIKAVFTNQSLNAPPLEEFPVAVEHKFKTIGSVGVASTSPASGTFNVKVTSKISITFNQEVNRQSAESKIMISPAVSGKFSWEKNIVTFSPEKPLGNARKYTVTVASGIKSVDGLDLKSAYKFSFTTENKTVLLKAPIINQPAVFACNVTAAAIALQYKGVNVGPWDVYNGIPKSDTGDLNNGNWGNPHLGFVGNIRGGTVGYGVYWDPINNYVSKHRPSQVYRNWNITSMLQEIDNGNPVILWWQNGATNPVKYSWKSKDANGNPVTIDGIRGMHSEVVVGYIGSPENPSQIIISDPWASRWGNKYRYISVDRFKGLWGYFNNTAIVVR
jgi:uncharacterized protein YvpB